MDAPGFTPGTDRQRDQKIQTFLKKRLVVEHVATFAGQSFPRFYYNVSRKSPIRDTASSS
jgi:hypothetical protein